MTEKLEELVQIGKTPLAEDAPNPRQVRDESPEFAKLEQEIGKLTSLNASPTPVNWREVVETSCTILRDKSKDLEVFTYLCRGLWENYAYAGLEVGFIILRDIIQEHWDIAYPPKDRARMRGGKLSWLGDRVGKLLANVEPKPEEKDTVISCFDLIREIENLLNDKLGDHAPILRELREPLKTYKQNFIFLEDQEKEAEAERKAKEDAERKAKEDAERKAKAAQQTETKKPEVESKPPPAKVDIPSHPPQSIANPNDIKKAFSSCHKTLYQIAKVKRAEKLSNPLPYRILRFSAWMSIEKMPFIENGKFVAPGPAKGKIRECISLLEQGKHADLIEAVESLFANPDFPSNAYWLDAHRFTATACEALGSQYNQAKQAVIDELAAFLRRFPELPEQKFNDDTDFADAQTKLWITEQVLVTPPEPTTSSNSSNESAISSSDTGGEAATWIKTAKEAKLLASKGQFAEGLSLLQAGVQTAKGQREQFFWLLEQARFCYETNHINLANPLLEYLEEQIARFDLEQWEPMLSVEVARLLLMCYKKSPKEAKTSELNKRLYARLCRLDVSAALKIEL